MKYSYGVVHGLANCQNCDWHTDSYKNAQAIAKQHAKRYGHTVKGELGISFAYYGSAAVGAGVEGEGVR